MPPDPETMPLEVGPSDSPEEFLQALGGFMVEAMKEQSAQAAEASKTRLAAAQIEADDNEKQRAHDLLVLQEETCLEEEKLKVVASRQHGREITLRVLGVLVIGGLFTFLLSALYKQENMDVSDTLTTFGLLIGFLYLLAERSPRGKTSQE